MTKLLLIFVLTVFAALLLASCSGEPMVTRIPEAHGYSVKVIQWPDQTREFFLYDSTGAIKAHKAR